jgi:hypothetical protein
MPTVEALMPHLDISKLGPLALQEARPPGGSDEEE